MVALHSHPIAELYRCFRESGMTYSVLADRSGVSVATLKRMFSNTPKNVSFANVLAVAEAFGVSITLSVDEDIRRKRAEVKARQIISMVQGTSALEAQALSESQIERMVEKTVHELLAGSNRKLWAS
tara:strand:- start:907 stop:1287 length:381 start_codon:yes stop_codon:yes gene_type:complete